MYMCVPTGVYILHSELEFNVAAVIKAHFKSAPEGEEPRTREEEEEGDKMQANPSYLPIETSYKSQESKCINTPTWHDIEELRATVLKQENFECK